MKFFHRDKKEETEIKETLSDVAGKEDDFDMERRGVRERVSMDGVNPNPLEYMVIEDSGQSAYTTVMYVETLPKSATFAKTFAPLFNFPGVESNVRVVPMEKPRAIKLLDKRLVSIGAERITAENKGDINRARKLSDKYQEVEGWAREIEQSYNSLFRVSIFFMISAPSLDGLTSKCKELYGKAKEEGINLSNPYSVVPEAYLSAAPYNKIFKVRKFGFKQEVIKEHVVDKNTLTNMFNHTEFYFSHKNGVYLGRTLYGGRPFFFDAFDKSNNGYSSIICGMTNSGKSTMEKALLSRNISLHDEKVVVIDYDAAGTIGEYVDLTYTTGGVVYQISAQSKNILNPFEVDVEVEYDEISGKEYQIFPLSEKIGDITHIIMTMIKASKQQASLETETFLEDKVSEIVAELFSERGIFDGDIYSLYEAGRVIKDGHLTQGQVKKHLPTISDFIIKTLKYQRENANKIYDRTYALIYSGMRNRVRELYYCKDTLKRFTKEEYENMERDKDGVFYMEDGRRHSVVAIKGTKGYFDGESTISIDLECPMIDYDISQIPKPDKPIAQEVCMNHITEHIIKKNSANPKNIHRRKLVVDEAHKAFIYDEGRLFMSDAYRVARKHNIGVDSISQMLSDYYRSKETEAMVDNASSIFLFKQPFADKKFLLETTPLTENQVDEVVSLGGDVSISDMDEEQDNSRRGEVCLINNDIPIFLKVDIMWDSERRYVTTDAENRKRIYAEIQAQMQ